MHELCSSSGILVLILKALEAFYELLDHSDVAADELLEDGVDLVKNFHVFHLPYDPSDRFLYCIPNLVNSQWIL